MWQEPYFLSIVMPVYNEEKVIEKVVRSFYKTILEKFKQSEFIIINDCSTDSTPTILERLKQKYSCIKVITNEHNQGHGPSLRRAYKEAQGEYIFHCDSDNQFFAEDFWLLWKKIKEKNLGLVMGFRERRSDPLHRKLLSQILRLLILLFFRASYRDINAPFKLYTRSTLNKVLPVIPPYALVPTILMVLATHKYNISNSEVGVRHLPRLTGKTFIRSWNIFIFGWKAIKEIIQFKKILQT